MSTKIQLQAAAGNEHPLNTTTLPNVFPSLSFTTAPPGAISQPFDRVSAEILIKHIVDDHLNAAGLAGEKVPRYELELAKFRGFNLDQVVEEGIKRILRDDQEIAAEIRSFYYAKGVYRIEEYRTTIAMTIAVIRDWGLHTQPIDWEKIELKVPNARSFKVDWKRDTTDTGFYDEHAVALEFREKYLGGKPLDVVILELLGKNPPLTV
jgi:hypothetical protein